MLLYLFMKFLLKPNSLIIAALFIVITVAAHSQQITFTSKPEIFMPNLVSTKNADVKLTFSPDGKKMLWGGSDWIKDKKDMDIWQSTKVNGKWAKPERVTFDSDSRGGGPGGAPEGGG